MQSRFEELDQVKFFHFHISPVFFQAIDDKLTFIRFQEFEGRLASLFVWEADHEQIRENSDCACYLVKSYLCPIIRSIINTYDTLDNKNPGVLLA